ncbi:MAG: biotin--[acetyl-CoA-carboxylase] ligase [Candidatus Omnitrophica bacterium]|jgi:BirA family biotin operon repressor/biotin-[acetyl-CoA-carboxylase] ligase|nr:biotin--[acetyl-CoA-carboxylase] ligase [Candidatus Omnitrophota bacterium]
MKEKILELLKGSQGYVSGDELSRQLGISRQGLWKHIQDLKDSGYDFVAVPHLGYHLLSCPDRLFEFEIKHRLNTKFIAKVIDYSDCLSSTNDLAMQLGMQNAASGTLVVAESQTKGRGRLGRSWFSPKYKGIYFSLLLRPKIAPESSPVLTILIAVSMAEAVKEISGLDIQIKWPNDLFLAGKKLAGILTEMNAEADKVNFMVMGVGLNVNNDKKSLASGATSLKEHTMKDLNRAQLLQEILRRIEKNYIFWEQKGAHTIIEKWRQLSCTLGKRVKVYCQHKHIEGSAADIDKDGGLLIRKESGILVKVMAGDVIHCR